VIRLLQECIEAKAVVLRSGIYTMICILPGMSLAAQSVNPTCFDACSCCRWNDVMVSPGTCQKAATLAGLSAAVAAADCMALHCCLSLAAAPACSALASQCSLFSRAAAAAGSPCCWDLSSYMRPGRQQDFMQGNWSRSGTRARLESAQALSVR
jgi:hypothetical protein